MDYLQYKNRIKQFLEGTLSGTEEIKLLEWIKQSPDNKKYFHYLQSSLGEEVKRRQNKVVTLRWQQLLERIEPEKKTKNPFTHTLKRYYHLTAPLAAAFVIGFIIAGVVLWNVTKPAKQAAIQQKITAPHGARTQFTLPDSSLVWLNCGSELLFPSHFEDKRQISLTGEAYFEVKKGKSPFVVSTVYGDVEVKGTSFNVKAYQDDFFETTLVKGKVNVLTEKGNGAALRPGYQAVYTPTGFKVDKVETELYTSWTEGRLIFRKESLPQMAKRLGRWYNIKIELDDDKRLEDIYYTATIEMESFSEVLNLLKVTASVDYTWDEENRVINLFYLK
ncbi:FecR family protein [Mariniphaga sediminis]|uniref:FecR family protein n=1 Tax=Mariniphaga sediminis TaxID=1628158 RepID=UPI0035624C4A